MKRAYWVIFFAAALASSSWGKSVDVLLVASDDATLRPILRVMTHTEIETRAAWTTWRGELNGKSIALARADGDPLNAVAATTLALRQHQPKLVIVFGAARAHDPSLRPGDIVLSERFAAFDGMISPSRPLEGGSNSLEWNKLPHLLLTAGEKKTATLSFAADLNALKLAQTLKPARGRIVTGVLGSAHQINREADRIAWLRKLWGTSTEDGESAHVAGCAALFGVPVFGFRIIDGTPEDAAEFALQFVKAWK